MSDARSQAFSQISVPAAYDRFLARQLFEPWARVLVDTAGPQPGASVLDIATGPGTVARLLAAEVGPGGRVVASDISAAMLAVAAAKPSEPGSARIEYVECSATALDADEESFQLATCQHGMQFFADRSGALREMHRVLGPGGVAAVSTWAAERPLGLFGPMCDALRESTVQPPYPRAFDPESYALDVSELRDLLSGSGFRDVVVETVELDCVWDTTGDLMAAIWGTPFGAAVGALSNSDQAAVMARLRERLGCTVDGEVVVSTASNIAVGVK